MNKKIYIPIVSLPIIFIGCNESSSNIQSSNNELIKIVDYKYTDNNATKESIFKECGVAGGVSILKGKDLNGNNQLDLELDEADINKSQTICNGKLSLVTDVVNTNLIEEQYKTYLDEQCGSDGGAVLVHGYDGDADGKLNIANIEGTNKYLVNGTQTKEAVDEIYEYSILCNNKDLYFLLDDSTNTLTIKSGTRTQTLTIKDGFSPIVSVLEVNKSNECNETGGFKIIDEFNTSVAICNGESPLVVDMNSSQLAEICGEVGSTKGYFIIDINSKKYPVCQPASLESVALGKTADGNLTVLGSQLSVQLPKETTKFEDTNSTECSNGAVKVTSFIDYNLNNLLDMNMSSENNSSKSYTFCKMGITVQPTAPKLSSILLADNNLSIDFNFSIPMNPATINPTTAFLECNDSRIFSYIDFNYSNSSPKAFSLFYDLEAGDYSCNFSVLKYVEDLNGTKMKDNNFTEINLSIPVL